MHDALARRRRFVQPNRKTRLKAVRRILLQRSINHHGLRFGKHGARAPLGVTMPRSRPETRRYRHSEAISALLLAGSLCALTTVAPATAQDLELRGEISESAIQN